MKKRLIYACGIAMVLLLIAFFFATYYSDVLMASLIAHHSDYSAGFSIYMILIVWFFYTAHDCDDD